jgi:hypothetical protein
MQRKAINPHSWTVQLGFDQAELIEGHQRMLLCSGQDAVDADGKPQHPGDSSRKNSIVSARSSTTMPMLSIRVTAIFLLSSVCAARDCTLIGDRPRGSRGGTRPRWRTPVQPSRPVSWQSGRSARKG